MKEKEGPLRLQARHKAWAKIARIDPQAFWDKVVLKQQTGEERREAMRILHVVNPEWTGSKLDVLKNIEGEHH
jgi:hypothetical protein